MERIGIFYGIGYLRARVLLDPSRNANVRGENDDVDSSDAIRRSVISWTGHREQSVPPALPDADEKKLLEVSARLTYCPQCWDADAKNGRAPYIRRQWALWSSVLCAEHETWLCARRPGSQFGSELNGWAPVWQTEPNWAGAAYLQYDPALRPYTLGFEAESIERPACRWQDLKIEFESLARDKGSILNLVVRAESYNVRGRIWEALEAGQHIPRVTNADLRGYRRDEPGWIADRICCLLTAVEIYRMMADREPALQGVRHVLETHPAAKQLVGECRLCRRRSHNWRQFPARSQSAARMGKR